MVKLAETSGNPVFRSLHTDRSKSMIGTASNAGFCPISVHSSPVHMYQTGFGDVLGHS